MPLLIIYVDLQCCSEAVPPRRVIRVAGRDASAAPPPRGTAVGEAAGAFRGFNMLPCLLGGGAWSRVVPQHNTRLPALLPLLRPFAASPPSAFPFISASPCHTTYLTRFPPQI